MTKEKELEAMIIQALLDDDYIALAKLSQIAAQIAGGEVTYDLEQKRQIDKLEKILAENKKD